jgi:hypothetical protein
MSRERNGKFGLMRLGLSMLAWMLLAFDACFLLLLWWLLLSFRSSGLVEVFAARVALSVKLFSEDAFDDNDLDDDDDDDGDLEGDGSDSALVTFPPFVVFGEFTIVLRLVVILADTLSEERCRFARLFFATVSVADVALTDATSDIKSKDVLLDVFSDGKSDVTPPINVALRELPGALSSPWAFAWAPASGTDWGNGKMLTRSDSACLSYGGIADAECVCKCPGRCNDCCCCGCCCC